MFFFPYQPLMINQPNTLKKNILIKNVFDSDFKKDF